MDTSQGAGRCCFNCRKACLIIVQNKFFKLVINLVILLSSIALVSKNKKPPSEQTEEQLIRRVRPQACEDIYLQHRELLMMVLAIAEMAFALLFFIEMLLKWIGFGFRKYFTDAWCWLEFLIVIVGRQ